MCPAQKISVPPFLVSELYSFEYLKNLYAPDLSYRYIDLHKTLYEYVSDQD